MADVVGAAAHMLVVYFAKITRGTCIEVLEIEKSRNHLVTGMDTKGIEEDGEDVSQNYLPCTANSSMFSGDTFDSIYDRNADHHILVRRGYSR